MDETPNESSVTESIMSRESVVMDGERRLVVAIDFGTTFTGVAFAFPNTLNAELQEIRLIKDWGPNMTNTAKVPSVISYSPRSDEGEQQWGASLSPDAVTMVNLKLGLDVQDNKTDELDLILQALDGMDNLNFQKVKDAKGYPEYTHKTTEAIVTDYLKKVFQVVEKTIRDFKADMSTRLPVDFVLTIPVAWSYRAKNSTLRAVRTAGFNKKSFPLLQDVIIVSEPEAAAIYTARYLKEEEMGEDFLRIGECFVLCDAGGGTVDVVSYKVTQLKPTLALESLIKPSGAKCGSIYIDGLFKRWLLRLLGERNYRKLAPRTEGQKISPHATEGRWMRDIMKSFDFHKRNFCNDGRSIKMDFKEPELANLDIPGKVVEGEFTITNNDMKSFFDPLVDRIITLIEHQRRQIDDQGSRLKNIFLVGGFGESQYLQNELTKSMKKREVQLRRPATSWSAVVQGAVICGIEKSVHKSLVVTRTCSRSYGIVIDSKYSARKHDKKDFYTDEMTTDVRAKGQISWLVRKGELLLAGVPKTSATDISFYFHAGHDKSIDMPVYMYEEDDLPERYSGARQELTPVDTLKFSLSSIPSDELVCHENPRSRQQYFSAHCRCNASVLEGWLTMNVTSRGTQLCQVKINCEG